MPEPHTMPVTPEMARAVLSGGAPLSALFGVTKAHLAEMAAFGHQLWKQGRRVEAQKVFRGLIALDESSYYGHAGMGLVAMSQEDFAAAEEHLSRALALEPDDTAVAVNLGETLLRQGRIEPAIAALQSAARLDASGQNAGAARARAILVGLGRGAAEMLKGQGTKVGAK